MTRPYQKFGSAQLDQMFLDAKDDLTQLTKIEGELKWRSVRTAMRLLDKVQKQQAKVLATQKAAPLGQKPTAGSDLFGYSTQPVIPTTGDIARKPVQKQDSLGLEIPGFTNAVSNPESRVPVFVPSPKQNAKASEAPERQTAEMSAEQAYRLLKVTAAAPWDAVEASRRDLVSRAQPDKTLGMPADKRTQLQADARLVNLAYKKLLDAKLANTG